MCGLGDGRVTAARQGRRLELSSPCIYGRTDGNLVVLGVVDPDGDDDEW